MPSAKAVTGRVQAFKQAVADIPGRLLLRIPVAQIQSSLDVAMEAAPDRVVLCHFNRDWSELSDVWQAQAQAGLKPSLNFARHEMKIRIILNFPPARPVMLG